MTDLEQQLTDHLRRRAAAATVRYDLEGIEQGNRLVSLVDLDDRRSRPSTIRLLAIAACLLAVVTLATAVMADRQSVDTVPPSESPTTECPSTTHPRAITKGAQMNKRFAAPVASAATAILMLGACGDDDDSSTTPSESSTSTTVAAGEGPYYVAKGKVEFEGSTGLGGESLDITAQEEGGGVTGEAQFTPSGLAVSFECADTARAGMVILGGEVTATTSDNNPAVGALMAVVILEAERDSVVLWFDEGASGSCEEVLESLPEDIANDPNVTLVVAGDDIQTGWDCEELCAGT